MGGGVPGHQLRQVSGSSRRLQGVSGQFSGFVRFGAPFRQADPPTPSVCSPSWGGGGAHRPGWGFVRKFCMGEGLGQGEGPNPGLLVPDASQKNRGESLLRTVSIRGTAEP